MGIEKIRSSLSNSDTLEFSVPPGFVSLTSFILKKVTINDSACTSIAKAEPSCSTFDFVKVKKQRTGILHNELGGNQKSSDPQHEMDSPLRACLPKGVVRGCSSCPKCLKVISRWHPEESCEPALEEAPVFHPTEEEFKDTLKYIASIRPKAEHFGICRIVPPPSWKPPCLLRERSVWENSKFKTHIQQVDQLKNLCTDRNLSSTDDVDMTVKRRKVSFQSTAHKSSNGFTAYDNGVPCSEDSFVSESGPEFTLQDFKNYADDFKSQYFRGEDNGDDSNVRLTVKAKRKEPSVGNVEGEYWRIIQNPSEEIEVLSGINISSRKFNSGFPVDSNSLHMHENLEYTESGWNLNNTPMLPGSLLLFENSETSTTSAPKLFVGMCFSSLCWKVEEHYLYSLCYLHLGSPKVWYGIPARYCYKFEGVVKKHLQQYSEQPGLLWKSITQLPPSVLISEGIPVYRCVQSSMEFVLTFPGAYHCEFDCGFNCSERVNFAPFDWLSYGQHIVELYSEQCRKTSISHDKLLFGAAMVAVRVRWEISVLRSKMLETMVWINNSGEDGVLTKLLKLRITQEVARREYLCKSFDSRKMEDDFDLTTKRECSRCMFDLHLSAIGCLCCPGKYTCLGHAKHLCSCGLNAKYLLLRYDINELNSLVKALDGDIEAVKKWSVEKLGLTMSSNVSREADDLTVPFAVSAPVEPVTSTAASPNLRSSAAVQMEGLTVSAPVEPVTSAAASPNLRSSAAVQMEGLAVSVPVETVTSAAASPNLRSSAAAQMEGPLVRETQEIKLRENVGASSSLEREVVIILRDDDEE